MKKYDKVKEQILTGEQIVEKISAYRKTALQKDCDKHGLGFNLDSRFSSAKITLSVDGYTGFYGNSSCSRIPIIRDSDIFKRSFLVVMNLNFERLMRETSERILKNAYSEKKEALKELRDAIEELETDGAPQLPAPGENQNA
jgi:hypothetical protein